MNKKTLVILVALFLLATPRYAAAKDASSSGLQNSGKQKMLLRPTMTMMNIDDKMKMLDQKVKLKEQSFRLRLNKLHDVNKRNRLLNLDAKIATLSGHQTMIMSDAIDKMTNILSKVQDKATLAQQQGVDTTALDSAITDAKAALASASAAVTAQEAKVYTIPVTTDDAAKENATGVLKTVETDLRQTHDSVTKAKQAVMKTLEELKKIWSKIKTITPSATMVPSITAMPEATATPAAATSTPTVTDTMSQDQMQQMNQ